ncbi:hypothetical protein CBR_g40513 [Chara braunii]|uniref:Reverse transcriptase domain-containing protein n=1 Tax=Chara braunii TaxID=69332 RepID=A0A388K211_CHABU|nr:hypothetical protein CBR_g40513 [Chara braunii]|eukprot:GBG64067.1 hypothetical protein CBR_g40513 [Chara braunii]
MPVSTCSLTSAMEQMAGETVEAYTVRMLNIMAEAKQRADAATATQKKKEEEAENQRPLAEEQRQQHDGAAANTADEEHRQRHEKVFKEERALLTLAVEWRKEAETGEDSNSGLKISLLLSRLTDLLATCIAQQEDIHCLDEVLDGHKKPSAQLTSRVQLLEQRPIAASSAGSSNYADRLDVLEIDIGTLKTGVQQQQAPTQQLEQEICAAAADLSPYLHMVRLLDEFADIFESPTGVVLDRPISHEIILKAGAVSPKGCIYRMSEEELEISIRPHYRYKPALKTRYKYFEWVAIPFGLTNAPTTFQAAMTNEFCTMLDQFVLVYLDGILVYSRTLEDHLEHLRCVLETLRRAKYKANRDKCEFVRQELEYLGHFITPEGISPLSDKIQVVQEWSEPRNVTDVRAFLGLAGYYQRFIKNYSKIVSNLTKLQCEHRPFDFSNDARGSFLALKAALLSAKVLRIYNPLLLTHITTDAPGYGIGTVLEQHNGVDWHPVKYF